MARFNEEIETIKLKQSISKNRVNQHANRLSILEMNIEREKGEFNGAGIGMIEKLSTHRGRKRDGELILNFEHFRAGGSV